MNNDAKRSNTNADMEHPSEVLDAIFGKLCPVDEAAYFGEVLWNRRIQIRLFVHTDGKNHKRCIESAREVFLAARKNEMNLFHQGIDFVGAAEWKDGFLHETTETSIEIFSNGEGHLVYLLWMVGSLSIRFSHGSVFMEASLEHD